MSASAKTSLGTSIGMGASAGTYTTLGEVVSFSPPKIQRETMDASDLATTGGKDAIAAGLYTLSPVTVQFNYIAGSANPDDLCFAAATDGVIRYFEVVVKAASSTEDITFAGFVTEYGPDEMTVDGKQTATLVIQPTGDIAQAATA